MSSDISNLQAPPDAVPSGPRDPTPALWNPNAAASWSLFFSPIFGAILHMKNWEAMGEPAKAATSKNWAIGSAAFLLALVVVSLVLPDSKVLDALTRVAGFALLLAWYYSTGKPQSAAVLARYGKGYRRRGWAKPLLFAVLALLGFAVVAAALGFVVGVVTSAA